MVPPARPLPPACVAAAWLALAGSAVPAPAAAATTGSVDWSRYADLKRVAVVTTDEDGDVRETTVWLAVLDGEAFIRTGGSRWGKNILRDPEVVLRVDGTDLPLRVEFVEEPDERSRVEQAFRDKYGFTDRMIGWFRGDSPLIMRLLPR